MKKVLTELLLIPLNFFMSIAFAWIPMLGWNLGVVTIFPSLPKIGYMTAFWLVVSLNYLLMKVIPIKEKE